LVVHPGTGHSNNDTLIDLAKSYMLNKKPPVTEEPVLVHRIDRDTSGIILIAKNKRFLRFLHTHFRDNQIHKTYFALCHGRPEKSEGTIEVELLKTLESNSGTKVVVDKNGQSASTTYHMLQSYNNLSKMEITIATGRTHQIRVHMAHIGCPIVGDVRYGDKQLDKQLFAKTDINKRLYLHAYKVNFVHPIEKKRITLTAPLPEEFLTALQ
jgi:RluA family pseudouridine synthase